MRYFFLVFLFSLSGCFMLPLEEDLDAAKSIPSAITLSDKTGNAVGKAIPFKNNFYVSPDHLWQATEKLFYEDRPIEVLVRDFQHDVLFFSLRTKTESQTKWQPQPPGVGQDLRWFDGFQMHEVQVVESNETFFSLDEITDLMSVNDVLEPGDSGSPLFDAKGNIYGMLIGTDIEAKKAYFVRSDIILDLAQEYLET